MPKTVSFAEYMDAFEKLPKCFDEVSAYIALRNSNAYSIMNNPNNPNERYLISRCLGVLYLRPHNKGCIEFVI